MSLGMQMSTRMSPELRLSAAQRMAARMLLRANQQLCSPWTSSVTPTTGLAGFEAAHDLLKSRGARGMLIGGCAKAVYQGHGWARIAKHKDVDVMVLDPLFRISEPFEGGIDWWLPETRSVRTRDFIGNVTSYVNGNGVVLMFGAMMAETQPPGLYLAPPELYQSALSSQALDFINWTGITFDGDAVEEYHRGLRRIFGKDPAKQVERWLTRPDDRWLGPADDSPSAPLGEGSIRFVPMHKMARDGFLHARQNDDATGP